MQGGTVKGDLSPGATSPPSPSSDAQNMQVGQGMSTSNWVYFGVPGVTDAWAPPSATVGYAGDVPRLPDN
jgi:hypothetical protein